MRGDRQTDRHPLLFRSCSMTVLKPQVQVLMPKTVYQLLGFLALGLAVAGFILPLLPGTPFVLLAAWCFARSSEKWHQRLLASELFGPVIRNWERDRSVSLKTKLVAISSMVVVGGASITFGMSDSWLRLVTALLMCTGAAVVLSLRTTEEQAPLADADDGSRYSM